MKVSTEFMISSLRQSDTFSRLLLLLLSCGCLLLPASVSAQNGDRSETVNISRDASQAKAAGTPGVKPDKEQKTNNAITAKREKLAIEFARTHHPELADLIQRLKKHKPREYKRAVRDLDNTLTKLDRFKKRDNDRYRLTLERWEVDSRIRLLAARVSIMGSGDDQTELKSLLKQRMDLQLELLKHEKAMAEKRVQKLEKSIAEIEQNHDSLVDSELTRINRSIKKPGPSNKKQK
ncbi:MAG TPA: hypothetical protein DDZ90_19630 [Planctomycetaceae bacterium]|nr:hypothetical protein [Gimesia sp.]HBL45596.1 hypothetical protein [Planctomycetaceae bacterium]|tara:strand:+ start:9745 stop:10449 length:705 start_codon:yes stop_codon:yes gene_type:complete